MISGKRFIKSGSAAGVPQYGFVAATKKLWVTKKDSEESFLISCSFVI